MGQIEIGNTSRQIATICAHPTSYLIHMCQLTLVQLAKPSWTTYNTKTKK